ncbi:hypothetical protein EC991_009689, partial [Linnemannia zychae]
SPAPQATLVTQPVFVTVERSIASHPCPAPRQCHQDCRQVTRQKHQSPVKRAIMVSIKPAVKIIKFSDKAVEYSVNPIAAVEITFKL